MQERETKWTPMKALGRVNRKVESLGIPIFDPKLPETEELVFSELANATDKELEKYLTIYGGYNAFLQTKIADIESIVGALDASFSEGYSKAAYTVCVEHEKKGNKRPTNDLIRGEVLASYESLSQLKKDIIEQTAELKRLRGLLETYKEAYGTVSRIVTLRTKRD